jgi:cupin 2 domain-containing protein
LETVAANRSNVWKNRSRSSIGFPMIGTPGVHYGQNIWFGFAQIRVDSWVMKRNLFEKIPEKAPEELFAELLKAATVRIERIVSFGQASPEGFWYDQTENEWVLLLEGSATLGFEEGRTVNLTSGDFVNIPAGERHRVEQTDPARRTVWLSVFYK